jgi:hypothetical protein
MDENCPAGDGIRIHDNSLKQRITVTARQESARVLGMPGRKLAGHLEVAPCMLDCGSVEVRWPSCTAGGHFTRPEYLIPKLSTYLASHFLATMPRKIPLAFQHHPLLYTIFQYTFRYPFVICNVQPIFVYSISSTLK